MSEEPIENSKVLGPPKNLAAGLVKAIRPPQPFRTISEPRRFAGKPEGH